MKRRDSLKTPGGGKERELELVCKVKKDKKTPEGESVGGRGEQRPIEKQPRGMWKFSHSHSQGHQVPCRVQTF